MLQTIVLGFISDWFFKFWGWIAGGAVALLGLMFSPRLRKYTIAGLAIVAVLVATYIGGYVSNHNVEITTHTCEEFRKWLVSGPATDKAIAIFKRHGLCV